MKAYSGPITQHQEYAITGKAPQGETFGVLGHNHKDNPFKEGKQHRKPAMKDGARGIPKRDGYHPSPDHGPTSSMAD